mmetsp:Transcript_73124/g.136686  ORF Transcript_73124/g.136686 Transcript_73124/m.136686 type:complete len:136 (-) Transcript_73124:148-555(-)
MPARYQMACSMAEASCTTFSSCNPFAFTYNEAVDSTSCKDPMFADWSDCSIPPVDQERLRVAEPVTGPAADLIQLWKTLGAETKTNAVAPEVEAQQSCTWMCLRPLPRNWNDKVQQLLLLAQQAEQAPDDLPEHS